MHLHEIHCAERRARSEGGKQHRREKEKERRQKRRKERRQAFVPWTSGSCARHKRLLVSPHQCHVNQVATRVSLTLSAISLGTVHLSPAPPPHSLHFVCSALFSSSEQSEFFLQDGSSGTCAGGAAVAGTVALSVRPRNPTDARDRTSVARCWQVRTVLRAVLFW